MSPGGVGRRGSGNLVVVSVIVALLLVFGRALENPKFLISCNGCFQLTLLCTRPGVVVEILALLPVLGVVIDVGESGACEVLGAWLRVCCRTTCGFVAFAGAALLWSVSNGCSSCRTRARKTS